MSETITDVIDHLSGISPGSQLDQLRDIRKEARKNSQQSYLDIFHPVEPYSQSFTLSERHLLAVFVALLHRKTEIATFYSASLLNDDHALPLLETVSAEAQQAVAQGPFGLYPEGPLTKEDIPGPSYQPAPSVKDRIGKKLSAALAHAYLLVFHPRDAKQHELQKLTEAGWSTDDIVTLSQLISFLAYQIRIVTGLKVLQQASPIGQE
ncbi:CMD domain protein [Microvirga sp. W0021]|uniref:CMD domain protein n=1 Tax=Hohaiivirga grylli TaxID=3133970 RepID=A0ABV0BIT6_9HYPH